MVSSWTPPSRLSTAGTPPRRALAPMKPWAYSVIVRASSWLRVSSRRRERGSGHESESTGRYRQRARLRPGADSDPGRTQRFGLVPVVEDACAEREQRPTAGEPERCPEQPPGRPEYQGKAADQERDHDDRDGDPGDGAAVEGGKGNRGPRHLRDERGDLRRLRLPPSPSLPRLTRRRPRIRSQWQARPDSPCALLLSYRLSLSLSLWSGPVMVRTRPHR